MILANGCNITKSEKFKGVWILSVPTVYIFECSVSCLGNFSNCHVMLSYTLFDWVTFMGVCGCVGMPVYISAVRWRSRTMSWLPWRSSIALWSCWISTLAVWVIPRHHPSFIWPLFLSPFSLFHTSHHSNPKPVKISLLSHRFCFIVHPLLCFYPAIHSMPVFLCTCHMMPFIFLYWYCLLLCTWVFCFHYLIYFTLLLVI